MTLQSVKIEANEAVALYRGRPVARVRGESQVRIVERLSRLAGVSRAADYIITVGEEVRE